MNILILNWRDPQHPLAGGAEISLFEHAKYWIKRGAKVTWFSSQFKDSPKITEIAGIKIIRAGTHYTTHLWAYIYSFKKKIGNQDIIIDNFHFIPYFTPLYIEKKKIIALIHEVAGKVWFHNIPLPLAALGNYLEPHLFKIYRNTTFITVSTSTRKELITMKVPDEHIHIIHNGITINHISKAIHKEKKPTLLFLGRISKDKGIIDVLKVYNIVLQKNKDTQLWIVGKEEKEGLIKELLKEFKNVSHNITYFGYVNNDKKFELLKKAWLLVHASIKEGWGLTVIEAASQGTPTVGYDVEGLRDSIIDGKTGLLSEKNPKALANNIIKLFSEKELYESLCQEAIKWSSNFDWEKSGKESYSLLTNLYQAN